ncbi:hypothetical protein [Streptomyces chartreusis]|uniref:hypothetical protein n=1 Tax=Streptomyces chartreusis TaxID=1969 RepID=UPI00382DFECC
MQGTPIWVLAVLVMSISANVGVGAGIFAARAGSKPFYTATLVGAGAGGGCVMALLTFWTIVA